MNFIAPRQDWLGGLVLLWDCQWKRAGEIG